MSKTLAVQLARFGDLVQTKRLILSLGQHPENPIFSPGESRGHLCVDRSLAGLAGLLFPGVTVHAVSAHGGRDMGGAFKQNIKYFEELAGEGFDEVYNLNFSGLNFALSTLFDPTRVRGYLRSQGQDIRGSWPRMAFRWARDRRSGINLVDLWTGFAPHPVDPGLVNPAPAYPRPEGEGTGIGVVLAGRNARRSLPPEVLAPVIQAVWEREGRPMVHLLGSAGEARFARELAGLLPGRMDQCVRDMAGKTDWAGLASLVAGLDLVLTPDTGTMHLAAHLGTRVEAFFLSSAWCFETGPYGPGHRVWQATAECAPCLESQPCPNSLACLEPFRDKGFLRALATNVPSRAPEGIACLESGLDSLGTTYAPLAGRVPGEEGRRRLRAFLARHLDLEDPTGPPDHDLARSLYREGDWMTETRA